jgi:hypothetical protein
MILGRGRTRVGKTPGRALIGSLLAEQDRYPELIEALREGFLHAWNPHEPSAAAQSLSGHNADSTSAEIQPRQATAV